MFETPPYLDQLLSQPTTDSKPHIEDHPDVILEEILEEVPDVIPDEIPVKEQLYEIHYLFDTNIIYDTLKNTGELLKFISPNNKVIIHIPTFILNELIPVIVKRKFESDKEQEGKQYERDLILVTLLKHNFEHLYSTTKDQTALLYKQDFERLYNGLDHQRSTNGSRPTLNKEKWNAATNLLDIDSLKHSLHNLFKKIGTIHFIDSNEEMLEMDWARDFQDKTIKNREYFNEKDEPLSVIDCRLLKFYLDKASWHLYTGDKSLRDAANDEGIKIPKTPPMIHALVNINSISGSVW